MKVRANTSGTLIFYLSFRCFVKIKINKSSSDLFGDEFWPKKKNSPRILQMEYSFENSISKRKIAKCLRF
jgi:hypothetical protein